MHYNSTSAATSGYLSASAEMKEIHENSSTRASVEQNRLRLQDQSYADVASSCGDQGDAENDDDMDMGIFSLRRRQTAGSAPSTPAPSQWTRAPGTPMPLQALKHEPEALLPNHPREAESDACKRKRGPDADDSQNLTEDEADENEDGTDPQPAKRQKGRGGNRGRGRAQPKKKAAAEIKHMKKARNVLEAKKQSFAPEQMWRVRQKKRTVDVAIKKRTVDVAIKSLEDAASSLLGLEGDAADALVTDLLALVEQIKKMQTLFTQMRDEATTWMSQALSEEDRNSLLELPAALISEILMSFAQQSLKAMDKERVFGK